MPDQPPPTPTAGDPVADRRRKLERLRTEFGIDPYGGRIDDLMSLDQARLRFDPAADGAHKADASIDHRPVVQVAGRIVLHRDIGKLIFMTIRDATGDLQVALSKKAVAPRTFDMAKLADLGDVVVARGPLGTTKTGELTVWAAENVQSQEELPIADCRLPIEGQSKLQDQESQQSHSPPQTHNRNSISEASSKSPTATRQSAIPPAPEQAFSIVTKSLAPAPEKWHGLTDPELRYRKRYIDLYANPPVMHTFLQRSRVLKRVRDFLTNPPPELGQGFIEVETPMMQSIAGGAAARPFTTHHNALDIELFLRIAPELYLKRLLVGGMPRVFEINRNFRNEGLSVRHNPEFTMLELYQAFGDYRAMMQLTETLIHTLAVEIGGAAKLPFGDKEVDYTLPFPRVGYHDIFEKVNGFASSDHEKLAARARELHIDPAGKDHDVLLGAVWEQTVESAMDSTRPTFIIDYPASLCPLTKTKPGHPDIAERFELYVCDMELANAYTELNDPDVQEDNFRRQLSGLKEEDSMAKMDMDFVEALRVGMLPAGGLGVGIDRLVMLLTNSRSIRDVILFPLMRPPG